MQFEGITTSTQSILYAYAQEESILPVLYPESRTKRSTRSSSLQRETGEDLRYRKQGVKIKHHSVSECFMKESKIKEATWKRENDIRA